MPQRLLIIASALALCAWSATVAAYECDPPCDNGECTAYLGELSCQCSGNWSGPACNVFVCERSNPCLSDGVCTVHPINSTQYLCICPSGFSGNRCQYEVPKGLQSNCTPDLCDSHGVCYDTVGPLGGFHCDCHDGYYGPTCNYTTNPCVNEHCSGNGHCRVVPNIPGDASALCTCNYRYGWAGNVIQCNIPLRFECLPRFDPCQNGGQCSLTDDPEDYTCICPPNFQGKDCEIPFDVCSTGDRCVNGVCQPEGHYFTCSCPPNHTGERCEHLVDPCFDKSCLNDGVCIVEEVRNSDGYYTLNASSRCDCPCGYTGEQCENMLSRSDPCSPSPCGESGICSHTDTAPWFSCKCWNGYIGMLCQETDFCAKLLQKYPSSHCKECLNVRDSFHCICENGWGGQYCDKDIDECFDEPCAKGQQCTNRKGTFSCT